MKYLKIWAISFFSFFLTGCFSLGEITTRYDKLPGGNVDESAYGLTYPLCLKTDPKSLRLTNEDAGNGLRMIYWTRNDGSQRTGVWYMSKPNSSIKPPEHQINIWVSWPTNVLFNIASHLPVVNALAVDEEKPATLWKLDLFEHCKI